MIKDPVCNTIINYKSANSIIYDDKKYYFCCAVCKWVFEKEPTQFLK
ncbi:MAG: YHS domain-containing protein [Thaumarchaeota archaeon]|nr:YHS domain-containing protein [Nitrososphaerota archaeon]MCY3975540.1 YHS domain-containing protein [Nitrososphaerota archaeon]